MNRHDCLIAFGSNQGDSQEIFDQAVAMMDESESIRVVARSQPAMTAAVGGPQGQPPFLNAVIGVETSLSPNELFDRLQQLETRLGRIRRQRWGARKIDLDLLLYDQLELATDRLTVPHPRMSFRRFVLEPAVEIAADCVHPSSGCTLEGLLSQLESRDDLLIVVGKEHFFGERDGLENRDLEKSEWIRFVSTIEDQGWTIMPVSDIDSFTAIASRAKLVGYVIPSDRDAARVSGSHDAHDLLSRAMTHPGPTIHLPNQWSLAAIELTAAISAMAPDQGRAGR